MHTNKNPRVTLNARTAAFTLIEVLVVVAIIALLVAILLPSLAAAREHGRSAMCLSNIKQMGMSIQMYAGDNKDGLPGPVHNPIYRETFRMMQLEEESRTAGGDLQLYWSGCLPSYLKKYIGDKSKTAELLDEMVTCPSVERIPVYRGPLPTGVGTAYGLPPGHYVANTGGGINSKSATGTVGGTYNVYYGTQPADYFGWINIGTAMSSVTRWPKKFTSVKTPSQEWALADLWAWNGQGTGGVFGGGQPRASGTWMYYVPQGQTTSVSYSGNMRVPTFPYHGTTKVFSSEGMWSSSRGDQTARLNSGRTNAVFFDGHGEGIRGWKGTVNPRFQ